MLADALCRALVQSAHAVDVTGFTDNFEAQAFVNRNVAREQQALASVVSRVRVPSGDGGTTETWALHDFPAFAREVLDWQPSDLLNAPGQPALPVPEPQ